VRVFKTNWFRRYAQRERISDAALADAIERMARGLVDADLGGGIVKQRVARAGQGRAAGFRMLIAYRADTRAVFLYGFAKKDRDNIDPDELTTLREIGATWLAADTAKIDKAVQDGVLQEVTFGNEAS
jgi:hypothetical protein